MSGLVQLGRKPRGELPGEEGTPWLDDLGRPMRRLEMHLSYHCPADCAFCSEGHRMRRFRRFPVTWGRVAKVLRLMARRGVDSVHLTGGEPTLHPSFLDALALSRKLGMRTSIGTISTMLSRPDFADRALPLLDEVLFSLHGPTAEVHDAEVRLPGSFDQVQRAMALAGAHGGVQVCVNTVTTPANLDLLGDTVALAASRGAELIIVSNVTPEGGAIDAYDELALPLQRLAEVLPAAATRAGGATLRYFGVPMCLLGDQALLSNDLHWDPRVTVEWVRLAGSVAYTAQYNWTPDRLREQLPACEGCAAQKLCAGIYAEAGRRLDLDAIRPLERPPG